MSLKPDFVPAVFNLGCVFALAGIANGSKEATNSPSSGSNGPSSSRPIWSPPTSTSQNCSNTTGRFAEARPFRRTELPVRFRFEIVPGARTSAQPAVSSAPRSSANTPFRNLLPAQAPNSLITWHIDYATEQQASLPPFDLAFNAVGNADWDAQCFDRAASFARQCARPLLNAPERVARTRRDMMPVLQAGVPDVMAARVARLSREEIKVGRLA